MTMWDTDMYEVPSTVIWGQKEQMYRIELFLPLVVYNAFETSMIQKKWIASSSFKSKQHLRILKAKVGGIYLNEKGAIKSKIYPLSPYSRN